MLAITIVFFVKWKCTDVRHAPDGYWSCFWLCHLKTCKYVSAFYRVVCLAHPIKPFTYTCRTPHITLHLDKTVLYLLNMRIFNRGWPPECSYELSVTSDGESPGSMSGVIQPVGFWWPAVYISMLIEPLALLPGCRMFLTCNNKQWYMIYVEERIFFSKSLALFCWFWIDMLGSLVFKFSFP